LGAAFYIADLEAHERPAMTAEYIHGMAKELQVLASQAHLDFLAYLLSMVEQEAQRSVHAAGTAQNAGG
jgi:hypothetical protein